MTLLTQDVMVQANIDVNRMSAQQKVQLTDEIYVQQPNLLASILVLPRYGVDMQLLEEPIHVLLVAFQAMKHCGHALPTISEDVQETCLRRLTATLKFSEGVPPDFFVQMITQYASTTPSAASWRSYTAPLASTTCCACEPTPRSTCCWPASTSWSAWPTSVHSCSPNEPGAAGQDGLTGRSH